MLLAVHTTTAMSLEPIYRSIGSAIRAKRRQLDWSQEKLASMLMMSRGTLANIEAGRQRVFIHQLYAFAAALDLKPGDLLPAPIKPTTSDTLPLPQHLNAQQKAQLSQLIRSVEPTNESSDKVNEKE